jgi:membrane protein
LRVLPTVPYAQVHRHLGIAIDMAALRSHSSAPVQPDPRSPALEDGSPTHLTKGQWRESVKGTLAHAKEDRLNIVAGSLAYRWFLSLFPTIIALLGISALIHMSSSVVNKLIHGAATALPSGASGVLTSAIRHAHGRTSGALGAVVLAALVALWSASSSMTVLQSGLDMAYEIPTDRKFLAKRAVALVLMLAVVVLGGAASALIVFGPQIGHAITGHAPVAGTAFVVAWTAVRWVAAVLLVMMLMAVLYWVGPNRESPRWQWLSPGAVVATLLWVFASLAFSFYTSSFGSYGKTYGAFAGVAILIFWLYVTGAVVLLGAEINAELERRKTSAGSQPVASAGRSPA